MTDEKLKNLTGANSPDKATAQLEAGTHGKEGKGRTEICFSTFLSSFYRLNSMIVRQENVF